MVAAAAAPEEVQPTPEAVESEKAVWSGEAELHDIAWVQEKWAKKYFEPDVIYPISHVIVEYLSGIGACEIVLRGYYGAEPENEQYGYVKRHFSIYSIEIRAQNGEFHQVIDGFFSMFPWSHENYGLAFEDWNSDGADDFQLRMHEGGSMLNDPSLFWIWDEEQGKFLVNDELSEISDGASLYMSRLEDDRVRAYTRYGGLEHVNRIYEYIDGNFVLVEIEEILYEYDDNGEGAAVIRISRLIDGEMQLVEERELEEAP